MSAEPVARLEAEASASRAKLGQTVAELRTRLNPETLMDEAMETMSEQGNKLVAKTKDTVSAHPLAIGTAVAAIGLALLARNSLANAKVDLGDEGYSYTDYDDSYEAPPQPAMQPVMAPAALVAKAQDSIANNPLLSVALGLAGGAILALITPQK